jgi:hypothetical protein
MKTIASVILITLLVHTPFVAQEKMKTIESQATSSIMTGYLVDRMCGEKMVMTDVKKSDAKAARHSRDCALDEACSAKGYGLVTGGKFYPFDQSSNAQAKEYLKALNKENNIKVEVRGTLMNQQLIVESIKDFKSIPVKNQKKK